MERRTLTINQVHQFMLDYQAQHKQPPTLREIVEGSDRIRHASSARYVLLCMSTLGLVEVVNEPNYPRRFKAREEKE